MGVGGSGADGRGVAFALPGPGGDDGAHSSAAALENIAGNARDCPRQHQTHRTPADAAVHRSASAGGGGAVIRRGGLIGSAGLVAGTRIPTTTVLSEDLVGGRGSASGPVSLGGGPAVRHGGMRDAIAPIRHRPVVGSGAAATSVLGARGAVHRGGGTPGPHAQPGHDVQPARQVRRICGATAAAESDRDQSSRSRLLRSPDPVKDQTYFLSQLSQAQLQRAVFPIGHLRKDEVRQLAESHFDLPNQRRRDSQGICFLGKLRFDDFLLHYLGERHGKIVDVDAGRVVGTHRGFWFYTVGQRRGLRMSDGPWYVVGKNIDDNIVYVSRLEPQAEAPQSHFRVAALNWIAGEPPSPSWLAGGTLDVKIRHGPHLHRGRLRLDGDGNASPTGVVELERHEVGLAPGQFAVFYHGDECLGGGVIADMGRAVYR
eukprot:ctg_387.g187